MIFVSPILTVLTTAVRSARQSPVETVTVFFLTVGFSTFAPLPLRSLHMHLLSQHLQPLRIQLYICAVAALTICAAEQLI